MNSAKEIKKSLTALNIYTPEEVDSQVAALIAAGKAVDDLAAPAISEELFNKALAAIDKVLAPGEVAINKSELETLDRQVEEALAAKDGPDLKTVINVVKSHVAQVDKRLQQTDDLVRTFVRAIKDVFVSTVDGVNTISKSQTSEFTSMKEAIHSFGKTQVKPQQRLPGQPAPAQGAAGVAAAQEINKSEPSAAALKAKVYDVIKSETKDANTTRQRREQLALAASNLHGASDLHTIRTVAKHLGITLES